MKGARKNDVREDAISVLGGTTSSRRFERKSLEWSMQGGVPCRYVQNFGPLR